jgi:hypothetical protein
MAASRYLLRLPISQALDAIGQPVRLLSSTATATATAKPVVHNRNHQTHKYISPSKYINSWKSPKNPREAELQLLHLRRDYAKKVKQVRKEYIEEMELQRIDKQIKDEKKKEALRIANEERRAAKAAARMAEAAERQIADEQFRQTLLKERAEKLEYWKKRSEAIEEKKKEKNEKIRRKSSEWVEESKLLRVALESIVNRGSSEFRQFP